jgi:hypothetical protein
MLYIPTTGDYLLRENFSSSKLKFLKHDIPLMALTATTIPLREGIIKSLKIFVSTSFFSAKSPVQCELLQLPRVLVRNMSPCFGWKCDVWYKLQSLASLACIVYMVLWAILMLLQSH